MAGGSIQHAERRNHKGGVCSSSSTGKARAATVFGATGADVDLGELVKIESDESFKPTPRTIHQLAEFLKLPAKKLMVLAGLLQVKDFGLQQASVRFAARSEPVEDVSPEEHAALEEYVKFLNEQ